MAWPFHKDGTMTPREGPHPSEQLVCIQTQTQAWGDSKDFQQGGYNPSTII